MLLPFFEGIIAAASALVLELSPAIFGVDLIENSFYFFLFTASIEEIVKGTFIYSHYLKLETKEKILSGAFFIGLGFALTEIILKQLPYNKSMLLPITGVFLVHLLTATLLGIFLRKKDQNLLPLLFLLIIFNVILHLAYNFFVLRYL